MSDLAQPAGDDRCAHTLIVDQQQPRALDADPLVRRLDQLAARRVVKPGTRVRGKLFGTAHVEQ